MGDVQDFLKVTKNRKLGVAVDITFSNNFPYRHSPEVPSQVRLNSTGKPSSRVYAVEAAEKNTVTKAYGAAHLALTLRGCVVQETDKCAHDAQMRPVPPGSNLLVKDSSGQNVGSVDAVAYDLRNKQQVAVDVKFSDKYKYRAGLPAPSFDFLQGGSLQCK